MDEIVVGLDVSKDFIDGWILPSGESFRDSNDEPGLARLRDRLVVLMPGCVGMEATGGYETAAAAELAGAGLRVSVVNPAQVAAFGHALGKRAKTDRIDAEKIARFCAAIGPRCAPLPDEQTRRLADLVARRRQIIRMRGGERQRLSMAREAWLKKSLKRIIAALAAELEAIDEEIDGAVRASPIWRVREDLLTSVPGVGKITARTLLAEMPELGQLDRHSVASLAGLAPFTRQSGTWRGKSFIGAGRASVRTALYMAALVAARHNPTLRTVYKRLVETGKPKLVALIAVARKLLVILNAIVRDQKPWQNA